MNKVKITLKYDLLTTEVLNFVEETIKGQPVGSEFFVVLEPSRYCPFRMDQLEDQLRTSLGGMSKYITIIDEDKGKYNVEVSNHPRQRLESRLYLNKFLFEGDPLLNGEVPSEVLNYLIDFKNWNKNLINYLKFSIFDIPLDFL